MQISDKYKARTPEETIKIVEDFFAKKNCKIVQVIQTESEIKTYSCRYQICFKDKVILQSNGKGISELYAKASCYGELYERFCGFLYGWHSPINYCNLIKTNYEKHGYYICENEKIGTLDDLLNNPLTLEYLKALNPKIDKKYLSNFFNVQLGIQDDKIILIPYQNIKDKNDIFYTNHILHCFLNGTSGLAAGNTVEEALIQGISELYERKVHETFLKEPQKVYCYLNPEILPNYLQEIIKKMNALNYEVRVYDLSYTTNLPVCMILVVDKTNHHFYYHWGSFPVAEIAIERCFTEIYQGCDFLSKKFDGRYTPILQNENITSDIFARNMVGDRSDFVFNDNFLTRSVQVNQLNDLVFLSEKDIKNNLDILDRINFINSKNNVNFYYRDISLTKEISAVHIVFDNFEYNCDKGCFDFYSENYTENPEKQLAISSIACDLLKIIKTYCLKNADTSPEILMDSLNSILNNIPINSIEDRMFFIHDINNFLQIEIINPFKCWPIYNIENINIILKNITGIIGNDVNYIYDTKFAENLIPLNFYYDYCIRKKKSLESYNDIMEFFGYNKLEENLTPIEFIEKSIFKNLQEIYNSPEYFEFINLFIKEDFV